MGKLPPVVDWSDRNASRHSEIVGNGLGKEKEKGRGAKLAPR
jgi:hypothetical protein